MRMWSLADLSCGAVSSLLCLSLSLAACNKAPSTSPPSPAQPAAPATVTAPAARPQGSAEPAASESGQSEDCTLATPLTPGVPGSPGHLIPSTRNPNGQSELAALMRSMEAALKDARPLVAQGQQVGPFAPRFRKIRCSWPTNLGDRDAQFDALAVSYLAAVAKLDASSGAASAAAFDGVLGACRSCHERACSGAIVAINALRLPGAEAKGGTAATPGEPPASPPPAR